MFILFLLSFSKILFSIPDVTFLSAAIIISSGTPERRLHLFEEYVDDVVDRIEQFRIDVSKLAQLINILRTELKDKPLKDAVKGEEGVEVFKRAMMKMIRFEKEKKLEEQLEICR